jgi:hypothetical protein
MLPCLLMAIAVATRRWTLLAGALVTHNYVPIDLALVSIVNALVDHSVFPYILYTSSNKGHHKELPERKQ